MLQRRRNYGVAVRKWPSLEDSSGIITTTVFTGCVGFSGRKATTVQNARRQASLILGREKPCESRPRAGRLRRPAVLWRGIAADAIQAFPAPEKDLPVRNGRRSQHPIRDLIHGQGAVFPCRFYYGAATGSVKKVNPAFRRDGRSLEFPAHPFPPAHLAVRKVQTLRDAVVGGNEKQSVTHDG